MIQVNRQQMRKAVLIFLSASLLAACAEKRAVVPEDKGPKTAYDYGAGKLPDGF
jgi:hypothetical protein